MPVDKAAVCHRQFVCEQGAGTQYFVRCPDGYLIDCGDESRAHGIADAINARLESDYYKDAGASWPAPMI